MVDVSVIVVNWNTKALLRACLRSVFEHTRGVSFDVWVVDNASTDGSVRMVADEFPAVRLIRNATNRGFGPACNQAIADADGRYLLLLNSDAQLIEDAAAALVDFMDAHPRVGALGCRIVNPDGSLQPSCYTNMNVWKGFAIASLLYTVIPYGLLGRLRPGGLFRRVFDFPDHDRVHDPDWFRAACMMLRPDALQGTGCFDEAFRLYCEEIDLQYRLRADGWRIAYTPQTTVVHHGEQSGSPARRPAVVEFWRSLFRFYHKHFGGKGIGFLRVLMTAGAGLRLVLLFAELAFGTAGARDDFAAVGATLRFAWSGGAPSDTAAGGGPPSPAGTVPVYRRRAAPR